MGRVQTAALAVLSLLVGCAGPGGATRRPAEETPARLFEGMGAHHRAITTNSPEAQRYFDQGLVWMFSFNHDEAVRAFKEAARLDPRCAMAWWGVAVCNGPNINRAPEPANEVAAWDALERARALRVHASPTERAMIDALSARCAKRSPKDRKPLDQAYARAMKALWEANPGDADIGSLYAESQMVLRPWALWSREGSPQEGTLEIVATLERVLALSPAHPGANHLMIHAVEESWEPGRADASANLLRTLVPASGHMVHMPSHIDVRTGRWALAAEANERAIEVDRGYRGLSPRQDFYRTYMAHNLHMLSYVSMMEGRSERALSAARQTIESVPEEYARDNAGLVDGFMFIEIEVLMRFGKWDDLLRVPQPPARFPITRAMWRFGRGVALAAKGDAAAARRERQRLRAQTDAIPDEVMAAVDGPKNLLDIANRVLAGEIAYQDGKLGESIAYLRAALAIESRVRYGEPPTWMIPVRHTLGAVLVKAERPVEAEREYREDLRMWPENGWSLHGLGLALRAQGRDSEADEVERRRAMAWSRADMQIDASCLCVGRGSARAAIE